MVEYYKDGITIQARSEKEEAEYKRLGFTKVEAAPEPAKKLTAAEKKAAAKEEGE